MGIYQNGVKVLDIVNDLTDAPTPIPFARGDIVGFRTTTASGTNSPNVVSAWFREL